MKKKITPYKDSDLNKKKQVEKMFDNISENYDGLNRVISFGADLRWRKKVIKQVCNTNPKTVLDIATGTGDLAIQFAEKLPTANITGLDLSEGMLNIARKKIANTNLERNLKFMKGDSEKLPFANNSFEAVTVSFGIRNFEDLEKGLSEIKRILTPGGIFVILETSVPTKFPFKQGYHLHSKYLLPWIGRVFSKDKSAYKYLSESASAFPYGERLNNILREIGFIEVQHTPQTMGVATIYSASK